MPDIASTLVWLLAGLCTCAQAQCVPSPAASPSPNDAYLGYSHTGPHGDLEKDHVWHRDVRKVVLPDGSEQFQFKARPGVRYGSIEPVDVGGTSPVYAAWRNGCGQLLDRRGRPLPLPQFDGISEVSYGRSARPTSADALLKLTMAEGFKWVRFKRGRLTALSANLYLNQHHVSTIPSGFMGDYLATVATTLRGAMGLVDLRDLREVLSPQWDSITGVGVYNDAILTRYLLAARGDMQTLFPPAGGAPLLDGFRSLTVLHSFYWGAESLAPLKRAALLVEWPDERGCRLLDMQLNPIMLHAMPRTDQGCASVTTSANSKFMFTDADGLGAQAYAFDLKAGRLRWMGQAPGRLLAAFESTGVMAVEVDAPQGKVVRLHSADGSRLDNLDYTGLTSIGCGGYRVQHQGRWWGLLRDGKITERLDFPYSC